MATTNASSRPTNLADCDDLRTQKETAAAQKLQRLARALREEQDEQKRMRMVLHAKYTLIEPYLPCVQSLDDLEEITMSELRGNAHHRGRFVWLSKLSELIRFSPTNTIIIVNDKNMDAQFMELILADQQLRGHGLFPPGTVMALKEPYVAKGEFGEDVLRVDHLTDLVTLPVTDERVPERFKMLVRLDKATTALQWKERGNESLKKADYAGAINAYTSGIARSSEEDDQKIRCDLYRNRSQAQLMLGRYWAAQEDAQLALCGTKDLDVKAKFRMAQSCYERGHWQSARKTLEDPDLVDDQDSQTLLTLVSNRQREEEHGNFDFNRMPPRLKKQPRIDAGSYVKTVEVRTEGSIAGRGLFATTEIEAGQIIICSKPICSLFASEPDARLATKHDLRSGAKYPDNFGLWRKLVNQLQDQPDLLPRVNQLQAKHAGLSTTLLECDGKVVIDVFQIHDILAENKHRIPDPRKLSPKEEFGVGVVEEKDWEISGALYDLASYINHSCLPNSYKVFIGDLLLLRAIRPIKTGEELTLSYVNLQEQKRREYLKKAWGIDCRCALCAAESSDGSKTTQSRVKASMEFIGRNVIADVNSTAPPTEKTMRKAKALLQQVNDSYDNAAYADMPRLASLPLSTWLLRAHYIRGDHKSLLAAVHDFFFATGYSGANFDGDAVFLESGPHPILPRDAINALQLVATVKLKQNQNEAAKQAEEHAKRVYRTLNGLDTGYKTINLSLI